jgi:hypothetical protein
MTSSTLREFRRLPGQFSMFAPCIDDHGIAADYEIDDSAEWPNNMMSRRTVVYENGVIAREGDQVLLNVDPVELALCQRISGEAKAVWDTSVSATGAEGGFYPTFPFFIASNVDALVPSGIDEAAIKRAFGGTLFPLATITVEPLQEQGVWWAERLVSAASEDADESDKYLRPWRALIKYFQEKPELSAASFVRIGEYGFSPTAPDESSWPPGTVMPPPLLPRLAVGLTKQGSLVGLISFVL